MAQSWARRLNFWNDQPAPGSFGTKSYELTVANGGLSLQDTPALSADTKSAVADATEAIKSGKVKVAYTDTKEAVQTLIDAKGK